MHQTAKLPTLDYDYDPQDGVGIYRLILTYEFHPATAGGGSEYHGYYPGEGAAATVMSIEVDAAKLYGDADYAVDIDRTSENWFKWAGEMQRKFMRQLETSDAFRETLEAACVKAGKPSYTGD